MIPLEPDLPNQGFIDGVHLLLYIHCNGLRCHLLNDVLLAPPTQMISPRCFNSSIIVASCTFDKVTGQ